MRSGSTRTGIIQWCPGCGRLDFADGSSLWPGPTVIDGVKALMDHRRAARELIESRQAAASALAPPGQLFALVIEQPRRPRSFWRRLLPKILGG